MAAIRSSRRSDPSQTPRMAASRSTTPSDPDQEARMSADDRSSCDHPGIKQHTVVRDRTVRALLFAGRLLRRPRTERDARAHVRLGIHIPAHRVEVTVVDAAQAHRCLRPCTAGRPASDPARRVCTSTHSTSRRRRSHTACTSPRTDNPRRTDRTRSNRRTRDPRSTRRARSTPRRRDVRRHLAVRARVHARAGGGRRGRRSSPCRVKRSADGSDAHRRKK